MLKKCTAVLLMVVMLSQYSWAAIDRTHIATQPQPVFGTIQRIARNTVDIFDENDKRIKQFVYMGDTAHLALQQRVRIDYGCGRVVKSIIVMKVFPYHAKGQNLGYLIKLDK